MACPAKWYFRYLIGLRESTTGALALGKAFHGRLARNFRQKMNTGRDMENGELSESFAEEWSLAIADAALRDDEDATELALTGKILVEGYVSEAARSVNPRAIKQAVQGEIAGVKVRGMSICSTLTVASATSRRRPSAQMASRRNTAYN